MVFTGLGQAVPGAAGAAGYAAAALGRRAAAMTRWWFLAGVIAGAPIVCLIGAGYVTALTGGGPLVRGAVAAGLLLAVLGLAVGGARATRRPAAAGRAADRRGGDRGGGLGARGPPGELDPVRPARLALHRPGRLDLDALLRRLGGGGPADRAAARGPAVPVIGIAFTVTAVLYLGLAVATVGCLGHGADLSVPLADLLQLAIGRPGGRWPRWPRWCSRPAVNAYLSGATEMLRELTIAGGQTMPNGPGRPPRLSAKLFLGFIALTGLVLIALSALRLADTAVLVSVPTTMFLCVYLSCTASAARILTGKTRVAAVVAVLAVLTILAFCGWALLAAAVVAAAATLATLSRAEKRHGGQQAPCVGMRSLASSSRITA